MYTLRWCKDDDWAMWQKLHEQAYRERVTELWGEWDKDKQREFARKGFEARDGVQFMICVQGEEIGYLTYKVEPKEIFIAQIVLAPEWRGQGIGTEILEDFKAMARRRRRKLRMQTFVNNPAKELYARLGFEVESKNDKHVVMGWSPDAEPEPGAGMEAE